MDRHPDDELRDSQKTRRPAKPASQRARALECQRQLQRRQGGRRRVPVARAVDERVGVRTGIESRDQSRDVGGRNPELAPQQYRVGQGLVPHGGELLVDYRAPDGDVADTCQGAREGQGPEGEGGGDPCAQPEAPLLGPGGRLAGLARHSRGLRRSRACRHTVGLHCYGASLYPRPRTVSTWRGSLGSLSILVRRRRTWTSTSRPSPK